MGIMKKLAYTPRGGRISQAGMLSLHVHECFFDRPVVQNAMDRSTHRSMRKGAATIRKISQRSMRYVSAKSKLVSSPGQPPRARRPKPYVRKYLYYYYDKDQQVAVIGPIRYPGGSDVPHDLEFGARVSRKNPRRRRRIVGGSGEIRIGGRSAAATKPTRDFRGQTRRVTYARLHTATQVARANALNEDLYGPETITGTLEPRPYMGPALMKEVPKFPQRWANSIRN